jgi:inorganic pyrophosphatase
MSIDKVPAGRELPDDFNVIVEIPMNADPIKYEVDKETGLLYVDRFMGVAMHYPCNYGYIPNTLSDDGDPVDVLVITPFPLVHGVVVRCRPVGVLRMSDEAGQDEKILAVPIDRILPWYKHWKSGRYAARAARTDPALLRTLQGSRTRQMGQGREMGRCRRGARTDPHGRQAGNRAVQESRQGQQVQQAR